MSADDARAVAALVNSDLMVPPNSAQEPTAPLASLGSARLSAKVVVRTRSDIDREENRWVNTRTSVC